MLREPLRAFWYATARLNPVHERTSWGYVKADPRYPNIWDANHGTVLEPAPELTMEAIRAEMLPPLEAAGATHEHVEFWETSVESPALRELRGSSARTDPDVLMVFEGSPEVRRPPRVEVREVGDPDDSFWEWYGQSRRQFGADFTDEVVEQLVRRDREVFHPAGLRWFVGFLDGALAGYASVLSLEGVGYIDNVVTMPPFRRRGVASAAVTSAVADSVARGDRPVHILAEEGGSPERLYERLGFRVEARIESFTRPLVLHG